MYVKNKIANFSIDNKHSTKNNKSILLRQRAGSFDKEKGEKKKEPIKVDWIYKNQYRESSNSIAVYIYFVIPFFLSVGNGIKKENAGPLCRL